MRGVESKGIVCHESSRVELTEKVGANIQLERHEDRLFLRNNSSSRNSSSDTSFTSSISHTVPRSAIKHKSKTVGRERGREVSYKGSISELRVGGRSSAAYFNTNESPASTRGNSFVHTEE